LKSRLTNIHGIKIEDMPDRSIFFGFRITLQNKTTGETTELYEKKIYGGDPKIVMRTEGNSLIVNVFALQDGEEKILADRLDDVLSNIT